MLALRSLPVRGAMPDGPGARSTRQGRNADEVRAERHRKKLAPSGLPRLDHSRVHFSSVAKATRTARRTRGAVLRHKIADSLQAHAIDGNMEKGKRWAVRGSTPLRHISIGARQLEHRGIPGSS
jgi:hypothetical protein